MSEKNKNWQKDFRFLLPVILIAFVVFANSLGGDFVYDDARQIVRNPLIQDSTLYTKAVFSDVWAFKGDGTIAAGNYWRPTFTAFNILNFRLFGLNPFGWHLLNILLHIGICTLAYFLLRRWNLSEILSFSIALIFAVHPVHTESVAWIAGSPDLLFGLFFLLAIWFAGNFAERRKLPDLIFALVFYAFALGSKEVAFLCFPVFWLIFSKDNQSSKQESIKLTGLFFLLASAYFLVRWLILGQISHPVEDSASFSSALFTVPSAFLFYLKQIIFPLSLGANYPLRVVESLDFVNFLLPLVISTAVLILLFLLAKRSFVQKIGLLIFILPLIPAMNFTVFPSEQIVHDRYLYLPLLGFLMIVVPYLKELAEKFSKEKNEQIILAIAVLISIPLGIKTFFYNQVWANNLVLWEHSVKIDANSAFNWSQYGAVLAEQGRHSEVFEAYNKSLAVKSSAQALLGRARANLYLQQFDEAVRDLRTVTAMPNENLDIYTLYQTYEALAIALTEQKKFDEAIKSLIEARKRLPIYHAALTEKLAVIYYQTGEKNAALRELENAKDQAKNELLPESKTVLLRLGMLYAELGEREKSRAVLQEYLEITAPLQDKITIEDRKQALNLLKQLQ